MRARAPRQPAYAPVSQNWSLVGVVVIGFVLTLIARFGYRSSFFSLRRESDGSAA
jgi:hypothetical protein